MTDWTLTAHSPLLTRYQSVIIKKYYKGPVNIGKKYNHVQDAGSYNRLLKWLSVFLLSLLMLRLNWFKNVILAEKKYFKILKVIFAVFSDCVSGFRGRSVCTECYQELADSHPRVGLCVSNLHRQRAWQAANDCGWVSFPYTWQL